MKDVIALIHTTLQEQLNIISTFLVYTTKKKKKKKFNPKPKYEYWDQEFKIHVSVHPWHVPEPLGIWEQPFLPDPGTEPLCSDSNTNRMSLPRVVRNSLVAPTSLACKKITKRESRIIPRIACFFNIITLSLLN